MTITRTLFNVGQSVICLQDIAEKEFGDSVYKNMGMTDFSDQFWKGTYMIRNYYIGNLNVMRQSACLVVKQITIHNSPFLFACTPMSLASASMMTQTNSYPLMFVGPGAFWYTRVQFDSSVLIYNQNDCKRLNTLFPLSPRVYFKLP